MQRAIAAALPPQLLPLREAAARSAPVLLLSSP
jgi:hypothetical protein